jgi:hypothetical protein
VGEALRQQAPDRRSSRPGVRQLAFDDGWMAGRARVEARRAAEESRLCARCRAREARYGFREDDRPFDDRPRTLCFECFRVELGRRQVAAASGARGGNAEQARLPLEDTLRELARRRRRAQIAARHALGL